MSFFAPQGAYPAAGLFGVEHAVLFLVTALLIGVGVFASRSLGEREVHRVIRAAAVSLWVLETAKITFVLFVNRTTNPNEFVPLYFCSITLYTGVLSGYGRGRWRRLGDVFLATGGLVGGAVFLVSPLTSLTNYPAWHFLSLHSFLLHGTMVYLGLLLLLRRVYVPVLGDMLYHVGTVSAFCLAAAIFNTVYDRAHEGAPIANLMFISKDFKGTPISLLYHLCGPYFPTVICLAQSFLPFLAVLGVYAAHRRAPCRRMRG